MRMSVGVVCLLMCLNSSTSQPKQKGRHHVVVTLSTALAVTFVRKSPVKYKALLAKR